MDNTINAFRGLRVAVTGGTSGLGLALVDQLRRAGAQVAFIARDPHRVSAVALRQPGTHGIAGDVARKETIHALALQVTAALGGLDILINNASTLGPAALAPLADTECEEFEAALATNVLGPFRLTKALLGALAASAREGRTAVVVNITSDAAVNAYAHWGAYGASKAALAHMSRIWDEELKEHHIRFIAHDPGDMDTPMHAQAIPDADPSTLKRPEQAAAELLARIAQVAAPQGARRMKAAPSPAQRPRGAKLLVVDAQGRRRHADRARLADFARPGDLLVANDAATLPASLAGVHESTGQVIEVRLAGRRSLAVDDVREFTAVLFGEGDHRTPTEHRPLPPQMRPGDVLVLGPLRATVLGTLGHARLVALRFEGAVDDIWAGIARHGKPVQYAHVRAPLALWDVWTRIAALPVAFEPPSAGFVLDWTLLSALKAKGVAFATLTHAAGLSSTGDQALDARLPLDEPYHLPAATVQAIEEAKARGGRVIALGTTVTRALEHAAARGPLVPGHGIADQKLGPRSVLRIVDVIVSGTHEPGTSHYELLRAFASDAVLRPASAELEAAGYLTHEFGDSVWIERARQVASWPA